MNRVADIISRKGVSAIAVSPDTPVIEALQIMAEKNIGSVLIMDGGEYVGIITERDVVRLLGRLDSALIHSPLSNTMSKPLITISINSSIKEAIQIMQQKNIRRLVIVDKEKMVGIITDKDIFRAIINNQTLIPSLLNDELIREHRPAYEQFSEYWFRDIFHKQ